MFCININMPSMSGGKSAIQYVPQKVHTFSTRAQSLICKTIWKFNIPDCLPTRRQNRLYLPSIWNKKAHLFHENNAFYILRKKRKKELLEKQWTVIFPIASFKLLVYAHVEVNWQNKCHFQGLVFGWPCVDIFAQEYGKNFTPRQTAHTQAKYQS